MIDRQAEKRQCSLIKIVYTVIIDIRKIEFMYLVYNWDITNMKTAISKF